MTINTKITNYQSIKIKNYGKRNLRVAKQHQKSKDHSC
jgi:hypothetical protein